MIELEGIDKKSAELINLGHIVDYGGSCGLLLNLSQALMISCRGTKHEVTALEIISDNMPSSRDEQNNKAVRDLRAALDTRLKNLRSRYQDD